MKVIKVEKGLITLNGKEFLALNKPLTGIIIATIPQVQRHEKVRPYIGKELTVHGVELANYKEVRTSKENISAQTVVVVSATGEDGHAFFITARCLWREEGNFLAELKENFPSIPTIAEAV